MSPNNWNILTQPWFLVSEKDNVTKLIYMNDRQEVKSWVKDEKCIHQYNSLPSSSYLSTLSWSQTSVAERSKVMLKVADLLEERLEEFAQAESLDQGKPVWLARAVDIPRACLNFRFYATSILHNVDM